MMVNRYPDPRTFSECAYAVKMGIGLLAHVRIIAVRRALKRRNKNADERGDEQRVKPHPNPPTVGTEWQSVLSHLKRLAMSECERAWAMIWIPLIISLWMIAGHAFVYGLPHWMYWEWNRPHEVTTTIETTNTTTTDSRAWCVAIGGDCVVNRD